MKPPKECPDCGGVIKVIDTILYDGACCPIEFDAAECIECGYIEYPGFDYED